MYYVYELYIDTMYYTLQHIYYLPASLRPFSSRPFSESFQRQGERHGDCVLQLRAAHLHHVREVLGLLEEALRQELNGV